MKTSCQFKEAFILLSTVKRMKYTLTELNKRLFTIECYTRGYDSKNTWVCKHHKHLFKDNNYTFQPNNDLVKSLPYDFVKTLKAGIFSPLYKTWMKKLQTILKKAQSHSIKRLRLVRLLKVNDFEKQSNDYMNAKQRVIYEVEMERLTFYVYLSEIYDIIGDEPWINDEVNCLANIGSN